ncbi:hypothetical protein AB4142_32750, partial [Variovorax sp. 2RAF20]
PICGDSIEQDFATVCHSEDKLVKKFKVRAGHGILGITAWLWIQDLEAQMTSETRAVIFRGDAQVKGATGRHGVTAAIASQSNSKRLG